MNGFVFTLTTRIWQLVAINLTALGLILAGLGLLGLAPALAATLWATARLDRLTAGQLARGMWAEYRAEFATGNLVVLPLLFAAGGALTLALVLPVIASAFLMPLALMLAGFALAALVTLSKLKGTAKDALANARTGFGMAPLRHVGLALLAPLALWAASQQPLLALYFGVSIPCMLINRALAPALAAAMPARKEFA